MTHIIFLLNNAALNHDRNLTNYPLLVGETQLTEEKMSLAQSHTVNQWQTCKDSGPQFPAGSTANGSSVPPPSLICSWVTFQSLPVSEPQVYPL